MAGIISTSELSDFTFCINFFSFARPDFDSFPATFEAMPDEYKNQCAVTAYKDYYWKDKRVNIDVKWNKKRIVPEWWQQLESVES